MSILRVVVTFDDGIADGVQGKVLLDLEKSLRRHTSLDIRVFKERMGDDSKLRVKLTAAERERV